MAPGGIRTDFSRTDMYCCFSCLAWQCLI